MALRGQPAVSSTLHPMVDWAHPVLYVASLVTAHNLTVLLVGSGSRCLGTQVTVNRDRREEDQSRNLNPKYLRHWASTKPLEWRA